MSSSFILLQLFAFSATTFTLSGGQDIYRIATLSNKIAADVHKKLSTGDENIFFSPVSISAALAMLFYGARGKTAEEMRRALGYQEAGLTDKQVHSAFQNLLEIFSKNSTAEEYLLYNANAVVTQKDYPVLAEYKNGLREIYKATARGVDFVNGGKQAVQEINDWVKLKTNGKLNKLLDEISPDTVMVLLNAVYFKGTWKERFDPKHTTDKGFFNEGLETERVMVPMMHFVKVLPYARLEGAAVLELPYKGEDISMVIILPDAMDGLPSLEQQLQTNTILSVTKSPTRKTRVMLPKFKLEYEKDLKTVLQKLGINDVFEDSANLSGMSKAGPLAVSKVMHKAVVEINEEGTEASAVTGVTIGTRTLARYEQFIVNHPFLFAIIDRRNNLILFQGRVNKL